MRVESGSYPSYETRVRGAMANPTPDGAAPASFAALVARAQTERQPNEPGGVYDFTAVTSPQLQGLVNDLIKRGRMSLDESSPMLGLMGPQLRADGSGRVSAADAMSPMNVFARLQAGLEGAYSRGDRQNAERLITTLDALKRLQGSAVEG